MITFTLFIAAVAFSAITIGGIYTPYNNNRSDSLLLVTFASLAQLCWYAFANSITL